MTPPMTETQNAVQVEVERDPGEHSSDAAACSGLKATLRRQGVFRLDQRTLDRLETLGVVEFRAGKMYPRKEPARTKG